MSLGLEISKGRAPMPAGGDELLPYLADISRGDERALETLYDATVGKLYALASAILRRPEDAEEVVCATYTQVWTQASRYDPNRASVLGWLMTICRTRALDRLRRLRLEAENSSAEAFQETAAVAHGPDELLSLLQQGSRVHDALAKLTPQRRELIGLAFLQGLSHQEIADRTGLALGTVKSHVRRALMQLREELGSP